MRNGTPCLEVGNVQNKKQNCHIKLGSLDSILKRATSLAGSHTSLDHKEQVQPNYLCCLFMLWYNCRSTEDLKFHMKAPCHLEPVLIKSGSVFGLTELNSITPQSAAGDMKQVKQL